MRNTWRLSLAAAALLGLLAACGHAADEPAPNTLTDKEKAGGWKLLFNGKTTEGWRSFKKKTFPDKGWEVTDGWLHCLGKGGGDIITDSEFSDFELEWEWKQAPGGNSGVKYPPMKASAEETACGRARS